MLRKLYISITILGIISFVLSANTSAQSYLLGMVDIHFCNHEQSDTELDVIAKAGEEYPLCIEFTNKSAEAIEINIEFLDSIITDDKIKNRACNASDRPKTQFGNFLMPYTTDIILPPQSTIQKTYTTKYPIGFSGLSHGCMAYHIAKGDISDSEMFTIRIRSIKYIDIFVTNTQAKQMIRLSPSPILTKIDNEHIISFGIENEGNVEEKIHIVSTISNMFGYQKDFVFDTTVTANTGILLTTPTFIMPIYGGPYRFKSKISYKPQFNFNITDGTHPSQLYVGGTKRTQTLLFVWTRQSLLTIIIIVSIIFGIFHKGKRSQVQTPKTLK